MKVNTIAQFHILQEIKKHFDIDEVTLELTSKNVIAVIDKEGDAVTFIYHGDTKNVIWEWGENIEN